jgi:release factor glutamine methyltransferase
MLRPKKKMPDARRGGELQGQADDSPAPEVWTIKRLLEWVTRYLADRKVDSPRLSAELIIGHVLTKKRIELYTQFDAVVDRPHLDRLHELVRRAGLHEPVAYLVGKTEFYSLEVAVCPDCLIPRPETELLVQRAIEFLRARPGPQRVLDLCTGSGCIAVAICANCKDAHLVATDVCDKALSTASQNVDSYHLSDRVTLLSGDLFDPILPHLDAGPFDLIVSNPPYVTAAEYEKLDRNVKDYEPRLALHAGDDGLDVIRRIIQQVDPFLKPNGALILEVGYQQAPAVTDLIRQTGQFSEVQVNKDFQGHDRVVVARSNPRSKG